MIPLVHPLSQLASPRNPEKYILLPVYIPRGSAKTKKYEGKARNRSTFSWGHRCVAAAILSRISFLSRIPSFLRRTDRPGNPFEEENDHEGWKRRGRDRFSRAQKRKKRGRRERGRPRAVCLLLNSC